MARSAAAINALSTMPAARSRAAVVPIEAARAERRRREQGRTRPSEDWVDATLKRVDKCRGERDQWRDLIHQAYELFLPQRNPFHGLQSGAKKGAEVLDSTPQKSLARWASRKQQALVPPERKYARLVAGLNTPDELKDFANDLLEKETDKLFAYIALSNAGTAAHEALQDAGIWNGAIQVFDGGDKHPVCYLSCPPDQLLLENGPWGLVENVYREHKLCVALIARQWPGFTFHEEVIDDVRSNPDNAYTTELEIVEGTVYDPARDEYDFVVMDKNRRTLGYWEPRESRGWVVFGPSRNSGETYRRGPALMALSDARTLQRVQELTLRNAAIAVAGLYKGVESDVLDPWNLVLEAGSVIPVAQADDLTPLESARDFDVAQFIIAEIQQSIEECFDLPHLGSVEETPVRSASEMLIRKQESAADSFSSDARLQNELTMQLVKETVAVLVRRGLLAPIRVDGHDVDIEFEGPVARAQKDEELLNAAQFLELIAPLGPAALAAFKPDVLAKKMAEAKGLWREVINSDAEMKAIRDQAAAAAQMLAEQAQADPAAAMGAVA